MDTLITGYCVIISEWFDRRKWVHDLRNLASELDICKRYEDAISTSLEAIEIYRRLTGSPTSNAQLASSIYDHSVYLSTLGRYAEAAVVVREAIDIRL